MPTNSAGPTHVMRFGRQLDVQGILATEGDADRRVAYLTKYLAKSFGDAYASEEDATRRQRAHLHRLHEEVRWLPCSPRAGTGCASASSRRTRGKEWSPARALQRLTTPSISVVAAGGSWSRDCGPARRSRITRPTGRGGSPGPSGRRHREA